MADNGRWFKLWCSAIGDPNLDNLDIADFGRWAKLGAYIKEHGVNGEITLVEPARKVIAFMQLYSLNEVIECIKKFPNVSVIPTVSPVTNESVTWKIKYLNWHKYQGDFSSDRVRRWREKNTRNVTEARNGNVTAIEEKRGEEKRGEENINNYCSETNKDSYSEQKKNQKSVKKISFNEQSNEFENISNDYWNKWYEVFPAIDVQQEIDKAAAWVMANPTRKKKDWAKFISNWLTRAQDRAEAIKARQDLYRRDKQ